MCVFLITIVSYQLPSILRKHLLKDQFADIAYGRCFQEQFHLLYDTLSFSQRDNGHLFASNDWWVFLNIQNIASYISWGKGDRGDSG